MELITRKQSKRRNVHRNSGEQRLFNDTTMEMQMQRKFKSSELKDTRIRYFSDNASEKEKAQKQCSLTFNNNIEENMDREINKEPGESLATAIPVKNVPSEYYHLFKTYGSPVNDWKLLKQSVLVRNNKSYDRLEIKLAGGRHKVIYFDITIFAF